MVTRATPGCLSKAVSSAVFAFLEGAAFVGLREGVHERVQFSGFTPLPVPRERLGTQRGADGVGQVLARRPVQHAEHGIERLLGADVTGGNHGFHAHEGVVIVGALAELFDAIRQRDVAQLQLSRRRGRGGSSQLSTSLSRAVFSLPRVR